MAQLIFYLVLLAAYVAAIVWIFQTLAPHVYVVSLLLSSAVPIIYWRSLRRVYGFHGGSFSFIRNYALLAAAVLVALIHLDFLALAVAPQLVPLFPEIDKHLDLIAGNFVLNRGFIIAATWLVPSAEHNDGAYLVSAALKSILVVPCALVARGLRTTREGKSQPAHVAYFHGQAYDDLRTLLASMSGEASAVVAFAHRAIKKGFRRAPAFTWPFTVLAYLTLFVPIVLALCEAFLLGALHSVSMVVVLLLAMVGSFTLAAAERAVIWVRSGYAKCPHSQCHGAVPLPIFLCPHCGAEHTQLVPGRYGVLKRQCRCGVGQMPTLFWLGKGRLRSLCPHSTCRRPMREELFAENLHIPIYGGPSTGKTMFMMASTWELAEGHLPNVRTRFLDEATERTYDRYWRPDFESGRVREKTVQPFPDAFLLSLRRGTGLPASLYLYDAAGEALHDETILSAHGFADYLDGIALLIDPLSLPSFEQSYRAHGGKDVASTTSRTHPEEALTRIVNDLEKRGKLSRKQATSKRMAVIVTKADLLGFDEALGLSSMSRPLANDWNTLGTDDSRRIEAWLREHEPHLVEVLKARFAQLRFFAISSLGHVPEPGRAFSPLHVLEPLGWLLASRTTFANPRAAKVVGRAKEIAAVAAVVGAVLAALGALALGGASLLSSGPDSTEPNKNLASVSNSSTQDQPIQQGEAAAHNHEPVTTKDSQPIVTREAQHDASVVTSHKPGRSTRFSTLSCGAIEDSRTRQAWAVGPDVNMSCTQARAWTEQLGLCGWRWRMPTIKELASLYLKGSPVGIGHLKDGRRWPAQLDPAFSGIGLGSWAWASGPSSGRAPLYNFNRGVRVSWDCGGASLSARAFAIRASSRTDGAAGLALNGATPPRSVRPASGESDDPIATNLCERNCFDRCGHEDRACIVACDCP